MEWGSFMLVGDMGQQLDLGEHAEELGRLRRAIGRRQSKDLDQDARIAALAEENLDLKAGLAALVRLLVARGVFDGAEIAGLVDPRVVDGLPVDTRLAGTRPARALDAPDRDGCDDRLDAPAGDDVPAHVAGTGLMSVARAAVARPAAPAACAGGLP